LLDQSDKENKNSNKLKNEKKNTTKRIKTKSQSISSNFIQISLTKPVEPLQNLPVLSAKKKNQEEQNFQNALSRKRPEFLK